MTLEYRQQDLLTATSTSVIIAVESLGRQAARPSCLETAGGVWRDARLRRLRVGGELASSSSRVAWRRAEGELAAWLKVIIARV